MALRIQRAALEEMERHARDDYPRECCGILLSVAGKDQVRRIANIQDQLHAENPVDHPRDAKTAYYMDPKELLAVLRESEDHGRPIRAFYHSHPEHGAYFSEEDQKRALEGSDEPLYPDAIFLVLSVVAGRVEDLLAVAWDAASRTFAPVELLVE
jgi:[CysO sulfur-carrier protein]-S-L-cysteine hydrolase